MEQLFGDPGGLTGGGPDLAEVTHGVTVAVEHQPGDSDVAGLLEESSLPAAVNQLCQITFQHDGTPSAGLGGLWTESNRPRVPVHVDPLQGDDLTLPPARQVGEPGEVLQVGGQGLVEPVRKPANASAGV